MMSGFDRYLKGQLKQSEVKRTFDVEHKILKIGLALADARRRKGLSQRELARHLEMSAAQISRTERHPEHSTLETLERFAHAVGMELDLRLVSRRQSWDCLITERAHRRFLSSGIKIRDVYGKAR